MVHDTELNNILGVIYGYYTQYPILNKISNEAFASTRASVLGIAIDIDDIFEKINNRSKVLSVSDDVVIAVTAAIINMCAHYRYLYRSSFGVSTTFYLVSNKYGDGNCLVENKFCAEYSKNKISENVYELKLKVLSVLSNLCPYIPDVQLCIVTSYDFNTVAFAANNVFKSINTTINHSSTTPFMVITKDLSAVILGKYNIFILRPKKHQGEDLSFITKPEDCTMRYIVEKSKMQPPSMHIDKEVIVALVATCGLPSRRLRSIKQVPYAINILSQCRTAMIAINELIKYTGLSQNIVEERMKALDPAVSAMVLSNDTTAANIFNMPHMFDPEAVKKLNETTFKKYPLDLNAL